MNDNDTLVVIAALFIAVALVVVVGFPEVSESIQKQQDADTLNYYNCSNFNTSCDSIVDMRMKAGAQCIYWNNHNVGNGTCWT